MPAGSTVHDLVLFGPFLLLETVDSGYAAIGTDWAAGVAYPSRSAAGNARVLLSGSWLGGYVRLAAFPPDRCACPFLMLVAFRSGLAVSGGHNGEIQQRAFE